MTSLLDGTYQGFLIFLSNENISVDVVLMTALEILQEELDPSFFLFLFLPDPDPLCLDLQKAVLQSLSNFLRD